MKKRNLTRVLGLCLMAVLLLGLLTGCTMNGAGQNLTEEGLIDLTKLESEVTKDVLYYVKLPFSYLLRWLYDFTNNYGLALIVFGLLIKTLLLPTAAKSKKSMMKMSRLTPQVKALEEKYGDDKQKYNEEVNKLYKKEGASGCGGCIWSLLPLLILIPLYEIIREPITWLMLHGSASPRMIGELRNVFILASQSAAEGSALSSFNAATAAYWQVEALPHVPELLTKLQAIAGAAVEPMNTRFLGVELAAIPKLMFWQNTGNGWWNAIGQFLLPLLSGGINFAAMWLSQKMNNTVIVDKNGEKDAEMAKSSNQNNKLMNFMMPLVSVYFGYVVPAGLSLYWITQGAYSLVQDYFLTKHYRKIYDEEDRIKQENAAREAAEEAERERIRAEKRALNPEGITENTSKKKLQERQRQEQAAKEAAYQARKREEDEQAQKAVDEARPFSRGRAYRRDRFASDEIPEENNTDNEE